MRHRSTDPVPMTKDEARPARAAKPLTDPVPTSKAKKFMLSVPGVIPSRSEWYLNYYALNKRAGLRPGHKKRRMYRNNWKLSSGARGGEAANGPGPRGKRKENLNVFCCQAFVALG